MTAGLVDLIVEEPAWTTALPGLEEISNLAAEAALRACGVAISDATIALLACDDARIAELNGDFRGRAAPTNVLSWPSFPLAPGAPGEHPPPPPMIGLPPPVPLGDVAISLQTCRREAEAAGLPLKNHCTHLILHGTLHLLGYDHQTVPDAELMEGIERAALAELGIPDPYT